MSKQFHVGANGASLGWFAAEDEQGAKDALARDAGYADEADMNARTGDHENLDVEEVNPASFLDTAQSRETSREILEACMHVAGGDEYEADRIWDAPSDAEAQVVWERVTRNGRVPSTDFYWGSFGSQWAMALGIAE